MPDIFRVAGPDGSWVRQSFGLQETIGDKRTLSSQLRIPGEFIALLLYVNVKRLSHLFSPSALTGGCDYGPD